MDNEAGAAFSSSKNANGINDQDHRQSYSIPGILHFIQHEWTRFEIERAHWEVERAELQVSILKDPSLRPLLLWQHITMTLLSK